MLFLLVLDALLKALLILGGCSRFLQRRHLALRMFVVHSSALVMECGDNVSIFLFDPPVQNRHHEDRGASKGRLHDNIWTAYKRLVVCLTD
jgi:hypothetical protein